ncbi:MAG TPA: hypothetical protein ENL01_02630 [Chlorobaculum parvum]|uniref:Uncharacterized protein n=1 Tax=Chlorobaculum parvum TaxID=274539 RepID=A0A7C5H6V3_9CHLB|nr:hypothetical protein [Chlorobaculum parvum]
MAENFDNIEATAAGSVNFIAKGGCGALQKEELSGVITESMTLTADKVWLLNGKDAEAMIGTGKAEIVTAAEATQVINRQSDHRIIASMVGGNYLELCAAHPPDCVFCKAEKAGIRCFEGNTR